MAHKKDPKSVARAKKLADAQDIPTEREGITQLREALEFLIALVTAAVRWKWSAPQTFLGELDVLVRKAVTAYQGYDQIPAEFADLSEAEVEQLVEVVRKQIDFTPLNLSEAERKAMLDKNEPYAYQPIGIDQTIDVVKFIAKLSVLVVESRHKNMLEIVGSAATLGPSLWIAIAGIGDVTKELGDLTDEEANKLYTVLAREFNVDDENLEVLAEQSWKVLLLLAMSVKTLLVALSKENPNAEKTAKALAESLVRLAGNIAILVRNVQALKAPPSSEPA